MTLNLTQTLLVGMVSILAIYDVIILILRGKDATISRVLLNAAKEYPIIAFALGVA